MPFLQLELIVGSMLRGCAGLKSLSAGQQVHAYAIKSGVEIYVVVGSSLAHMYMKSTRRRGGDQRKSQKLTAEMKLLDYKPDTGSILHDMNLEEKEDDLVHHSEKLAIAFALMNTPDCFPIRVMKSLRVCNDCHVAIKYISAIRNQEIIVRDASRFHHFKQGQCSCGDYW
ncbi:hypothetical protein Ccrd_022341 [Cynara cardunculus var. scolymus]|uniref:DYW domain-containing protein n=1 Tax=Cynara cardunculus var. scolymus TaxID=59895 RepID=A0A103XYW7_CYNCS|nr:hypothetical protein Ccrd_022341 [Cynara cardunculus var. scolymus]